MGSATFADKIFEVFKQHPNEEISLAQAVREAGDSPSGKPFTDDQVQSAISNLRNRGGVPIVPVVAGRVYRYEPGTKLKKEAGTRLFEFLALLKNGSLLIQDDEGRIYRATEME